MAKKITNYKLDSRSSEGSPFRLRKANALSSRHGSRTRSSGQKAKSHQRSYQDFMLVSMADSSKRFQKVLKWRRDRRKGRFYPTGFKKLSDGRVEVTFYLPPTILQRMSHAINNGKRIRLFVPQ